MGLEDKTEAPTQRRRHEARLEGQVARSVDVNSALVLLSALLIIKMTAPALGARLREVTIESFTHFPTKDLVIGDISTSLVRLLLSIGTAIAPLLIGVAVVGFASNALQVGLVFSGKALAVKGERLNPISGMARMFSARAAVELLKSILKIVIIGYIVYSFLQQRYSEIASLANVDYVTSCAILGGLTWGLLLRTSVAIFVIAALDYMYQRYQTEKQLKMTKQEVKDDYKRSDGDPLIKAKIRHRQREMSQRRMMQEVPNADVVIVNPTSFAVALRYDTNLDAAPRVLAKGRRIVAQRIRDLAEKNNIPIVENVPLARTLYASVEIGDLIPAELYQAVAEVLAYIYRLSHRGRKV